ncbi:MAG: ABC transporter ATP-binding protein [Dehalococcoidales bacterium]
MSAIIECENVRRTYKTRTRTGQKRETVALKNLSFQVPEGIVFGLLGPNGAGKTTTIRILSTLLIPDSGKATVGGFDVVKEASKVRRKIGLILGGERGLYGRLTAQENLRYFAALNHMSSALSRTRVAEVIKMVGLTDASDRPVEQYSRGMKQRLHVARGLLADPEILFMDEPTIGLDPVGAQELRQMIPVLIREGKTIVLTTHYMSEADELSDQIAIIDGGAIVASGTPSDIKRKFSKVEVCEVILKQNNPDAVEILLALPGFDRVVSSIDGPIQKLTLHLKPGTEVKQTVPKQLGSDLVESLIMRDPTLEEAYLSIFKS